MMAAWDRGTTWQDACALLTTLPEDAWRVTPPRRLEDTRLAERTGAARAG